jgi:hypothetical protein
MVVLQLPCFSWSSRGNLTRNTRLNPTVGKEKSDSQEKELKFTALGWKLGFHSKVHEMEMSVIIFSFMNKSAIGQHIQNLLVRCYCSLYYIDNYN